MKNDYDKKFIKELKSIEVKSKSIKKLIHAFDIIEMISHEVNRHSDEIIACYKISRYP